MSDDGRRATLAISGLQLIEQGQWPAHDAPAVAARMSYRIEWVATNDQADFVDPAKQLRFRGFRATARLEASVEIPSTGFSWKSDPMATSSASFAVLGDEANGRYFAP